jgi:hypothetical protein
VAGAELPGERFFPRQELGAGYWSGNKVWGGARKNGPGLRR